MSEKQKLIILTGPTAAGKTALSIRLAQRLDGEIISADSMQVYRHMDIGSAKVTAEEMGGIRHHLIDVLEPTEEFDVYIFQTLAKEAMKGIYERGHIPIIVGGTGFYIQSVLYDIDFTPSDENGDGSCRKKLTELAREKGSTYLHQQLSLIDPESAGNIHPNNVKRVIRALEYYETTGLKFSEHNAEQRKKESPYDFCYFVLTDERSVLYERIDRRVEHMLDEGLVEEVKKLKELGLKRTDISMQGFGYKEILDFLDGVTDLERAVYLIKRDTRHFAKRQLTWFRRERDVIWVNQADFGRDEDAILAYMLDHIKK